MRILVLNYEFPPIGGGGGRASADLAASLVRAGHEVSVLTAGIRGLPQEEIRHGVRVLRLATGRRSATAASFAVMLGYVATASIQGIRLVRSWKPELLHAHFAVPTGAAAWIISRLTGVRYVLTTHLGDVPGGVPEKTGVWFRWVRRLTPPIWRDAAAVVAVSEYTRRLASMSYHVPIRVIPNGVDLRDRPAAPSPVGTPPRIIFVGRFQPQKNLLLLIEILGGLRHLAWEATLVGDGPLRPAAEAALRRHGLTDRVRLTGWLSSEQAQRELRRADILLMPSRAEGFPVVAVQALACGVAVVGSRVGGLADLIEDGVNGAAREPDDLEGFCSALGGLVRDAGALAAMKTSSYARAERYDIDAVAHAYESVFAEVLRS